MTERGGDEGRDDGQALGGTDGARAANLALRALVRAARSFLFYDAHNEAITHFLDELRQAFAGYTHRFGDLDLVITSDAITLGVGGEPIYREPDRERSLAFRLYRDGVRRLIIRSRVGWDDLVRLLEVLSVRYTGLRQQEDDMVTLLRRAGFEHIEVQAVQGFVSDDHDGDDDDRADERLMELALARVQVPADFDLPPPRLTTRKKVSFVPLPQELLARAAAEAHDRRLPLDCLSLATVLLESVTSRAADALSVPEVVGLLEEIRDFLLTEGEVRGLVELRKLVAETPRDLPGRDALDALVAAYGDAGSISRLVRSVPPEQVALPPAFHAFVAGLPGDPVAVLMDLIHDEHSGHLRRVLRQALEPGVPARQADVMQRIRQDPGQGAPDMLRALSTQAPEAARRLVMELVVSGTPALQIECIHIIGRSNHGSTARRLLLPLLEDPHEEVRATAGRTLATFQDPGTFAALQAAAERHAAAGLEPTLAEVLGTTLAAVDPVAALALFLEWTRPRSRLRLSRAGEDQLPRVALPGLGALDDPQADAVLKAFAERNSGELARAATQARVQRARRLQAGDPP